MDKVTHRDFYMIILPGIILTIGLHAIFPVFSLSFISTSEQFQSLLLILLIGYIIGHPLFYLGGWLESIIDRLFSNEHPIINLIDKGVLGIEGSALKDAIYSCFGVNLNNVEVANKIMHYDNTFTLIKQYTYQQSFSDILKSLTYKATMFRNLIPVCIIFIAALITVIFFPFLIKQECLLFETNIWIKLILIALLVFFIISLRLISQKIYLEWFKEVLSYFYIFMRTNSNITSKH